MVPSAAHVPADGRRSSCAGSRSIPIAWTRPTARSASRASAAGVYAGAGVLLLLAAVSVLSRGEATALAAVTPPVAHAARPAAAEPDAPPVAVPAPVADPAPARAPAPAKPLAAAVQAAKPKALAYREVTMVVTAYCPCEVCCGQWSGLGKTASGAPITANGGRFVAGDPGLKFGTRVSIPGYHRGRTVPVLDRGGDITTNRLDVFMPTHEAARQWGRQTLKVRVYK